MMDSHNSGPVKMVPSVKKSELAASIDMEERDLPEMRRHYAIRAEQYRSFFTELVAREFTREEAMKLTELEFLE